MDWFEGHRPCHDFPFYRLLFNNIGGFTPDLDVCYILFSRLANTFSPYWGGSEYEGARYSSTPQSAIFFHWSRTTLHICWQFSNAPFWYDRVQTSFNTHATLRCLVPTGVLAYFFRSDHQFRDGRGKALHEQVQRTSLSKFKTHQIVQNKRKSLYMCYYLLCLLLHLCYTQSLPHAILYCLGLVHDCPLLSAAKLAANAFSARLHLCPDMACTRRRSASDVVIKTLCEEVC